MPKPRILGADGAGLVDGKRVVINPGIEHGDKITVVGEHMDGTHAELIAVPEENVYPIPDEMSFEEAAAFPLVFETAYRMLVDEGGPARRRVGARLGRRRRARRSGERDREGARRAHDRHLRRATRSSSALEADVKVNHASEDVVEAVKAATDGRGADVVVESVGEATWQRRLQAAGPGGRITVCGATSGPNPPAALHRIWWKQLTIYGSTMGTKEDFEGVYELVKSGRAKPVVDEVFPLSEARAAHERMEAGDQLGKIVLTIP